MQPGLAKPKPGVLLNLVIMACLAIPMLWLCLSGTGLALAWRGPGPETGD